MSRRIIVLAALVCILLATSCQPAVMSSQSKFSNPASAANATPTLAPTEVPTQTPPAVEPLVIKRWRNAVGAGGSEVFVEVTNPNSNVGLIRAAFELVALDAAGAVLEVQSGALPGAPCCTIYRLAPSGNYAVSMVLSGTDATEVASVEVQPTDRWMDWVPVEEALPQVTVTGANLSVDDFLSGELNYSVTGRIAVDEGGPYNVQVIAFIEGSDGWLFTMQLVDCVVAGAPRAFEASAFSQGLSKPRLGQVIAVTSTAPGITSGPPGC